MSTQTSLEPAKSVHSVAGTTVKFEFSLPSVGENGLPLAVALDVWPFLALREGRSALSTSRLERLTVVSRVEGPRPLSCAPSSTPSSSPSGRRARAGVHAAIDAAAGCPRPSTAPILVRSEAMDPDASPGLRCTRCAALCRPQARAEHQLDQALDARVASARR